MIRESAPSRKVAARVLAYACVSISLLSVLASTYNCNYAWWGLPSTPWSREEDPALTVQYNGLLRQADRSNEGAPLLNGSSTMKVSHIGIQHRGPLAVVK